METQDTISDAPAQSGVDDKTDANLSIEDLASSFVEKVETETEESTTDAKEDSTETQVVESEGEESEDVLSKFNGNEDDNSDEDSEEDSVEEDSDEESEEEDNAKTSSKGLDRALSRIGKLTKRAKSAEEEVASLKEQVEALKNRTPDQTQEPTSPVLEKVNTLEDLETLRKEAISAKKWALSHIGKEWVETDGKEYSDQDIRDILSQAEDFISEKIPDRAKHLQEKQAWKEDTANVFPWIYEAEGANYEKFVQVRKSPQYKEILDTLPNGDFVAGVLVRGINALEAEQKAQKPKAKAKSPPPSEASGAVAPPVESNEVKQRKKKEAILGKGNVSVEQFAQFLT